MEKKKLLDRSSEFETAVCTKHPILVTAATTVATAGVISVAKGPTVKAGRFVKNAAVGMFSGSKGEAATAIVAEQATVSLAEAAFKGGGSEEAVGLASNGLMSLARWLRSLL